MPPGDRATDETDEIPLLPVIWLATRWVLCIRRILACTGEEALDPVGLRVAAEGSSTAAARFRSDVRTWGGSADAAGMDAVGVVGVTVVAMDGAVLALMTRLGTPVVTTDKGAPRPAGDDGLDDGWMCCGSGAHWGTPLMPMAPAAVLLLLPLLLPPLPPPPPPPPTSEWAEGRRDQPAMTGGGWSTACHAGVSDGRRKTSGLARPCPGTLSIATTPSLSVDPSRGASSLLGKRNGLGPGAVASPPPSSYTDSRPTEYTLSRPYESYRS